MKLKQYPEYMESGVKWIGKIPSNWSCVPFFAVAKLKKIVNCTDRELLSVYLNLGVVRFADVDEKRTNATSDDLSKYQAVDPGDFVLNNQQAWRGSVGVSKHSGIVSPAYLVLQLSDALAPEYANYLLRYRGMVTQYLIASKGVGSIQRNLYWPYVKRSIVIHPSYDEQINIAQFLNSKEKQIKRFIRNKRRLIQLLKEQKQAIINQAVTRGINSKVIMKPSGLDWLGNIPEHWNVRRLRTVAFVRPSGVDKITNEGEIPVKLCNYVDVYKNERILDSMDFMHATATPDEIANFELRDEDVLITKDSEMWNDIAVPAFVPKKIPGVICAYHLAIIRPVRIDGEFLFRAFLAESVADQFRVSANGVTRYGLSQGAIKSAWFPIPPKEEQHKIVDYINESISKIYLAIEKAEKEIILIQEYRTRLISDVVTGKVDIRNIKVEDVADEELVDDLSSLEEIEELEDSIGEVSDED